MERVSNLIVQCPMNKNLSGIFKKVFVKPLVATKIGGWVCSETVELFVKQTCCWLSACDRLGHLLNGTSAFQQAASVYPDIAPPVLGGERVNAQSYGSPDGIWEVGWRIAELEEKRHQRLCTYMLVEATLPHLTDGSTRRVLPGCIQGYWCGRAGGGGCCFLVANHRCVGV